MRLLVVFGAGASYECWPPHVSGGLTLPLANSLFSTEQTQNDLLKLYNLMGIASRLRRKAIRHGKDFDVEAELAKINEAAIKNDDFNDQKLLFLVRFYLQELIQKLTEYTLETSRSDTLYVTFLQEIKDWVAEKPNERFVDIVTFNYDTLIESAMSTVYSYDWKSKNEKNPLSAYYSGNNVCIYKPHGSINWGRVVEKEHAEYRYQDYHEAVDAFKWLSFQEEFQIVDPVYRSIHIKRYIPAIAIPFKGKSAFEECPDYMFDRMFSAVQEADEIITIGWKGGDEHFTDLLRNNKKITRAWVVSPHGETTLDSLYPGPGVARFPMKFADFVYNKTTFVDMLKSLSQK